MAQALATPIRGDRITPLLTLPEGETLERVALALNSTLELKEVLHRLGQVTLDVSGADRCSLFLLEGDSLHPAVCLGVVDDDGLWEAFRSMGPIDLRSVASGWDRLVDGRAVAIEDASAAALLPDGWVERFDLHAVVLVPLLAAGEPCGLMAVDYSERRSFARGELGLLETIGSYAGVAVRNARLYDELGAQLRRTEVLHDLSETFASSALGESFVQRLNDVLVGDGIRVVRIAVRDRNVARRLGAPALSEKERVAWSAGQRKLRLDDDLVAVPVRLGRRVIGSLHVDAPDIGREETSFLETLTHGVAEVIDRGAMRVEMEEARRERAVTEERGRIAADLHDTAGQMLVAISLLARRESEQLPPDSPWAERFERLAELAERGKWEINRSIQALSFFPAARRGLAASIRALARSFEKDSGMRIVVDVEGSTRRLSARVEQALYRVAHEALANAWRHGRGANVRVALATAADEISLTVVDDGVGFKFSEEEPRIGISSMRRAVDEVGGALRIRNVKPHGVRVEARVPKEGR